jgi:hypothetical protein
MKGETSVQLYIIYVEVASWLYSDLKNSVTIDLEQIGSHVVTKSQCG